MSCFVPRTCTEIPADGQDRDATSRPLDEYRDVPAYVLLGDPGVGKTTAFEREWEALEGAGSLVSARDFLTFDPDKHPEWGRGTLFIDGLDEVRAGSSDARTPLDAIRGKLDWLGRPRFRLSCRAADWLGANDRTRLAAVSPDACVRVLRLDPLTDSDIEAILKALLRVDDSRGFVLEARERGVDGFLTNPQSLRMLVEAVAGGGGWPASRGELFEAACRQMAREHNLEHGTVAGPQGAVPVSADGAAMEDVLDAAGRLCAVQLISGVAGYALTARPESGDFPAFDRCAREWDAADDSAPRAKLLRAALATKLFGASPNGGVQPVHRHVAEFLGARHVAGLVRPRGSGRGLPASRVLALITGDDGIVVTPLRGLSAWLAALCPDARRDLVERDPIGVSLYGDVSGFSTDEKRALLTSLERQMSGQVSGTATFAPLAAFVPLVTPAMEPAFRDMLIGLTPKEHPAFARYILRVLARGPRLPDLSPILLDVVRGSASSSKVRSVALDAFIRHRENGLQKTVDLRELLDEVHAGRLADPDDELRGTLLAELYPGALSPSDVWEYCSPPSNRGLRGRYFLFMNRTIAERCPDAHVAGHLDELAARLAAAAPLLECRWLRELPVDLLVRGLESHGDEIDTKRLYDWLGVGLTMAGKPPEIGDGSRKIRSWLERRPETQKSVFAEGLQRARTSSAAVRVSAYDVEQRLYGSTMPGDFGLWCLRQAMAVPDRRVAEYLLERAFDSVREQEGDDGLSVDVLIEHARVHPVLADAFAELSVCNLDDAYVRREERARLVQHRREEDRRRQVWIDRVRTCEDALRANRGAPHLLHQIAAAYFGHLLEVEGEHPRTRLDNLFLGDDRLVETALMALRGAVGRSDVPPVDEIIGLREQNREHYLALPFLAGLSEIDRTRPDVPLRLDDRQMRTALAFLYCGAFQEEPPWYQRLLISNPGQVADILIRCATPALRCGKAHVRGIEELARENHAHVAAVASLRILRSFPVRCTSRQLVCLNYLLWSALRHADRKSFTTLIERKLLRTSMNVAQRARWLAAGFVLSSDSLLDRLLEFARGGERRVRELAAFLGDSDDAAVWLDRLGTTGLQVLVRLLGASFGPHDWPSTGTVLVTPAMEASDHVRRMVRRLAESPTGAAGAALDALASDECLVEWNRELIHARDEQRAIRRDAAYRHPDIEQVCRMLKNGPSANAGDLVALVSDRLDEIAQRVRTGNDNGWRLYWNEGKHRRPVKPKDEESCRDALLGVLRQRLPDGVDPQPEGRYANDRRADMRIACGDFQIPVEIKRHYHRDLWSALRNQLIAQYTIDPATGGYGIYLVLWFGETAECRVPPPPSGSRPDTPEKLKARLEDDLTPDEARRVLVRVLDVSAPAPASTSRRHRAPEPKASIVDANTSPPASLTG